MTKRDPQLSELERWIAISRMHEYAERKAEGERRFWATHTLSPAAPAGRLIELNARRRRPIATRRAA